MKVKQKQADGSFIEVEMDPIEAVKAAVQEGVKPLEQKIANLETANGTLSNENKSLKEKVEKIEKMPAFAERAASFIRSKEFLGVALKGQGIAVRSKAHADKSHNYEAFTSDEQFEEYQKFMLAVKLATFDKNPEALAWLFKHNEACKKTAYAEGSNAAGGYLVAPEYLWDMVMLARERTFALQECTVLPMGSNSLKVPTELTGVSVAWDDEAGAVDESEGTFGQVSLTAKRMNAYSKISNEMLADSAIDIVSLLTDQFGYAAALELDNEVLNGDGTKLMSGVLTAAAGYSVVLATGSTNFSAQTAINYSDMMYRLAEADAAVARFKVNRISTHYLRTLRDANGNFIWASPASGQPGTIWGAPYRVSERITSTSAVSTAFAAFGDWKKVYLGRRLAFASLDVDPYSGFLTYQTNYRLVSRWAGAIARATAFVRGVTAAS